MTRVVVFTGPTLSATAVRDALPSAVCLGPAARGDVYLAAKERPHAICVIDGYFEHRPALTHKEILWALSQGIPVFGAASMGALRAVELSHFGMIGSGSIFEDFASGKLEDDDEVAVAHGPAEHGYRAGSVALVNVRATLAAAVRAQVLTVEAADAFVACAKGLFYAERNWPRLLEELSSQGHSEVRGLAAWLAVPDNLVDQKRQDALHMLGTVRELLADGKLEPPQVQWALPLTSTFRGLMEELDASASALAPAVSEEIQLLGPEVYWEIMSAASLRALALSMGDGGGGTSGAPSSRRAGVTLEEEERHVLEQIPRAQGFVLAEMENVLRLLGDYERVVARASKKRELCRRHSSSPGLAMESLEPYFQRVLRRPLPGDLSSYARSVGFTDVSRLADAVHREMVFLAMLASAENS